MRKLLYHWIKTNWAILVNAGSLVGTTAVTGIFGFAYWWMAARLFPPASVGLASAEVSAMLLLGILCILGLGTLLIGELPRQPGKEASLISAALLLVGGVGIVGGIIFALVASFVSADFQELRGSTGDILLFAAGVGLTTITTVLDQALIGLLRGSIQFWRNALFAGAKLVFLVLAGFLLFKGGEIIYGTWAAGNVLSLLLLLGLVALKRGRLGSTVRPDWRLLRRLGLPALQHHVLNLIVQAPTSAMPVLVTILLSATTNAWFYIAWMISGLVFIASYALTTVLYAINSAQPSELMRKIRLTLGLGLATCILSNMLLQFGATQVLDLFGHIYAQQAAWSLRILALAAFPMIIKFHYIAVSRIHSKMVRAVLPVAMGSVLELGIAAIGAHMDGLIGLSFGWVVAVCIEAVFMFPTVYRAAFPAKNTLELSREQPPSVDVKRCAQCDTIVPAHASFCGKCGEQLDGEKLDDTVVVKKLGVKKPDDTIVVKKRVPIKVRRCPQCDAIMPVHANFCAKCGKQLGEQDTRKLNRVKPEELDEEEQDKKVKVRPVGARWLDIAGVALPLGALLLWALSLPAINVGRINDLGLVSVLPASTIISFVIISLSFCLVINCQKQQLPVILLHFLVLIFMLYSITTLVEQAPRFAVVYRHAGYTDFIMRTGTVDPNLDAYFNWPGFFVFSAFLTRIVGYHDILPYAPWSAVFFNMIYLLPMYVLFNTATTHKRTVWLALWFFCVTNWIAQDYYSPQGLNFFLYLVILAILVKWFSKPPLTRRRERHWRFLGRLAPLMSWVDAWFTAPDSFLSPVQPGQRRLLLACVVVIYFFSVFSHPLTPFFMIASVLALVIFGRCAPRWLPILMIVINVAWLYFMAQPYLIGNINHILSEVGRIGSSVSENVAGRVKQGSLEHTFISDIRLLMTFGVWVLAFAGAVRRLLRGYRDSRLVLLAIVPFPLFLVQSYGGEMLLRIYLFTLPPMVFFAASLFYPCAAVAGAAPALSTSLSKKAGQRLGLRMRAERHASSGSKLPWRQLAIGAICLVLIGGFLFTRYGNEREDYMTNAEIAGVQHLYTIAPRGSLLMTAWDGAPWEAVNYEQYDEEVLYEVIPDAVSNRNVNAILQFVKGSGAKESYLLISRTQRATAELGGYQPGLLDRLARDLQRSGKFTLIFSNTDAQIYKYNPGK
ncbi:MAG: hypothetical protein E6I91_04065 [Chloroflexi bacterium]|nr:MAG: hypothetical protein E6I91_04065 [Chloroflexota bacterium]